LTIFANTTQRELQFVTRIQLSKNKRKRAFALIATNPERLVNGAHESALR
jgi:hypothetical protein